MGSRSRSKLLRTVVHTCGACPFMEIIHDEVTSDHGNFLPGYFCLHKHKRGFIVTDETIAEAGCRTLTQYMRREWGADFPPDCPLPDAERINQGTGKRDVDL